MKGTTETKTQEIKEVFRASVAESASFLFCFAFLGLVASLWMPYAAWLALLPLGVMWGRLRGLERWAEEKFRCLDIKNKVQLTIDRGEIDSALNEIESEISALHSKMWSLKMGAPDKRRYSELEFVADALRAAKKECAEASEP